MRVIPAKVSCGPHRKKSAELAKIAPTAHFEWRVFCCVLQRLNLSKTSITDRGVAELAKVRAATSAPTQPRRAGSGPAAPPTTPMSANSATAPPAPSAATLPTML